jgi:hypothetical protein
MMLRWKLANARSNDMALPASTCALATGSVSRAAWTSAEGMGGVCPQVSGQGAAGGSCGGL